MKIRNKQHRALIIEDSEILINFYKSSLSKYNCVVDLAFTVQMAKEKIAEHKYDLYVVDKKLPDGDALELIGHSIDPKKALIISAYLQRETDVETLAGEFNIPTNHIRHKPIIEEDFDLLVDEILGKVSLFQLDIIDLFSSTGKFIFVKIKKMTMKQAIFMVAFCVFLALFFPTLEIWKIHQFHDKFCITVSLFAEKKFKNFTPDQTVSNSTFVERNFEIEKYKIRVRVFPDSFVNILISSKEEGAHEYWLSEEAFLKVYGIKHDDTFIDIFLSTWKKTFNSITSAMKE